MIFLISAIRTNSLKSGFKDGIPRLCGEKSLPEVHWSMILGSPPPMRGKAVTHGIITKVYGITPAYAGKRRCGQHSGLSLQDHPRLCGEKFTTAWFSYVTSGSPPPMRGKACPLTIRQHILRITPAYAGKSIDEVYNVIGYKDHPRLCGEKVLFHIVRIKLKGSPPPMRGKVTFIVPVVGVVRITPAYAGKRSRCTGLL